MVCDMTISLGIKIAWKEFISSFCVKKEKCYGAGQRDFLWLILFFAGISTILLVSYSSYVGLNNKIADAVLGVVDGHSVALSLRPSFQRTDFTKADIDVCDGLSDDACVKFCSQNSNLPGCMSGLIFYPSQDVDMTIAPRAVKLPKRFWCKFSVSTDGCVSGPAGLSGTNLKGAFIDLNDPLLEGYI